MSHIQSTINDIINEIKDINHINNVELTSVDLANSNNNNDNDPEAITQLIQSISSCTSIDEFTKSVLSPRPGVSQNDDELLSMIIHHTKHMKLMPYELDESSLLPPSCRVNIDEGKLKDIKRQIESCFELVSDAKYDFLTIGRDGFSSFSRETLKWTQIKDMPERPARQSYLTSVYVRGNFYTFGSVVEPNVYTRYSLAEKKLYRAEIAGVCGGVFISVCFDGDRYIYLVGGVDTDMGNIKINAVYDRVDRFNIDTQQFEHVGKLSTPVMMANTFFHKGMVYVIYGAVIFSFDIQTLTTQVLRSTPTTITTIASCFDGNDNVYILSSEKFIRFTLSTKTEVQLTMSPIFVQLHGLIYDGSHGSLIYLGGVGKNHQYSIQDNKWSLLNDNDHVGDRAIWARWTQRRFEVQAGKVDVWC
ncbi:hypothetical protein SAMD00019534_085900 [Acytostelium subglobosum LB1]|uniref:hypothetical protein n=1 Tax=Acytostelium subglobosum LB1 TaxID=1410327 RepID=UPI000644DF4C|nr:hypothetical protein SAMD00019534_085900 [Acytostelium subglobosum LB1]GAM25415.1 hypothetical protein SAMD00019534_085900 [Acytostelium subglobosum LB1]|eukprot:XP_012751401.1 hypothetical protein SAMD00019534_085900 [Acytostelium subglobosum LB1]